jgi:hypothetical protein
MFGDAIAGRLEAAFVSAVVTMLIALATALFVVRMCGGNSVQMAKQLFSDPSGGWGRQIASARCFTDEDGSQKTIQGIDSLSL